MSEELTEEQRLEAAKKKYEALKKKNKKKGKKSKKADTETSEEKDDGVQDLEVEEKEEDKEEDTEETEVVQESKVEADEDDTKIEEDNKEVKEAEIPLVETVEKSTTIEEEDKEEVIEEPKEESPAKSIEELTAKLDQTELDDELLPEENTAAEQPKQEDGVDSLFPESAEQSSFLETLKTPEIQSPAEPETIKETIVTETLDSSKYNDLLKQNEELKAEVKALKLLKLDHLEQIETLQDRVQSLEAKLSTRSLDLPQSSYQQQQLSGYDEDNFSLSPSPPLQSQPVYYQQQQQHFHSNLSSETNIQQISTNLQKFKGWNVDMTNWRSIGEGVIVKL